MKPSLTKEEQVKILSDLWECTDIEAKTKLNDVLRMFAKALANGDRIYMDDFGTLHVEIKSPVYRRLPGHDTETRFAARVNVKFNESKDLLAVLNESFSEELEEANKSL